MGSARTLAAPAAPRADAPRRPSPNGRLQPGAPLLLRLPPEEPLDLDQTFASGQIFRWRKAGDTWYGPYREGSLAVRRTPDGVEARALGVTADAEAIRRFLGLDVSLREVYRVLEADPPLRAAIAAFPGLRLLRQEPWECLANFLCSQWNNIPKIERTTAWIARRWGRVCRWPEGVEVAAFPPPEALAAASPEELRAASLGYRWAYLREAARRVAAGEVDPEALRALPCEAARAALLALPGIGRKVADCILLFALDQPEAFPVDVWVRRALHECYAAELAGRGVDAAALAGRPLGMREYRALHAFARERWGRLAGYAQQYLYHARRLGVLPAAPRACRR